MQSRPKLHGEWIGSTLASYGGLQDLRLWTLVTQQLAISRQNPPLGKYRGKWENGRTNFSGGFWGVDFSWTSGEDPRSIGALLAALSPRMPLNCTKSVPENLACCAMLLHDLPISRLRFLA